MKKLSVIIPAYNAENTIERCVRSILNHNEVDLEIIIINDGSTDQTKEICEKLQRENDRIHLVTIENGGVSHARNIGLKYAQGQYIQFVDADDYIDSNMCSVMLNSAEENRAQLVMCGFERIFYRDGKIWTRNFISCSNRILNMNEFEDSFPELMIKGYMNPPWNKLYAREIIDMANGFPEDISLGEDLIFTLNIMNRVKKVCILSDTWYKNVEQNINSLTRKFKLERQNDNKRIYYSIRDFCRKNHYSYETELVNGKIFLRTDYLNLEHLVNNRNQISSEEYIKAFSEIVFCKETKECLQMRYGLDYECMFYKLFLKTHNRCLIEFSVHLRIVLKNILRKLRGER